MAKYRVTLDIQTSRLGVVEVEAFSRSEAANLAEDEWRNLNIEWTSRERLDVETVDLIEVKDKGS